MLPNPPERKARNRYLQPQTSDPATIGLTEKHRQPTHIVAHLQAAQSQRTNQILQKSHNLANAADKN